MLKTNRLQLPNQESLPLVPGIEGYIDQPVHIGRSLNALLQQDRH